MKRILHGAFLFGLAPLAASSACASMQIPQPPIARFGDYQCAIEDATGVSSSGKNHTLEDAPREFVFSAYESPVTPEELREGPLRGLDRDLSSETEGYEPEHQRVFSASIAPDIFAAPAHQLRSSDLHSFHQDGVAILFEKNLSFFAYGPARGGGVAVYSGSCVSPSL